MSNNIYRNKDKDKSIDMNKLNDILKTYNSFSGTDMVATMYISGVEGVQDGAVVLGSLQTISYSIHMERKPVRSISNINAKSYVMGPRTIAGSLVFAVFDKHFTYEAINKLNGSNKNARYILADEMPPFDITITFANEYHQNAKLAIYGVRLVNEGQVMSINDILTENTYQFVATDIQLLTDNDTVTGGNYFTPSGPTLAITTPDKIEWIKPTEIEETKEEKEGIYFIDVSTQTIKPGFPTASYAMSFIEDTPTEGRIVIHKYSEDGTSGNWTEYDSVRLGYSTSYPIVKQAELGVYKATYFSLEGQMMSPEAEFVVNSAQEDTYLPAPIILDKTSTAAIVSVSSLAESISYKVNDSIEKYKTIPLSTGTSQVVVKELLPNTAYVMIAESKNAKSAQTIFVTEQENQAKLLDDFNNYVALNSYLLLNKGLGLTTIEEVIQKAKEVYLDSYKKGMPLTPAQSIFKVKLDLEAEKKANKKSKTTNIDELIEATEMLCYEATIFFNRYKKYEDNGLNISPEVASHRLHEITVKDSTDMLIFEPFNKQKVRIRKEEAKLREDKKIIKTVLDHNIYKVYGIETSGRYTGFVETLAATDTLKRKMKQFEEDAYATKELMLALAKEKVANYSSTYKYNELITACANDYNEYFNDAIEPVIVQIDNKSLFVQALNPLNIIHQDLYLCIEEYDKVMDNQCIRKVKCQKADSFSAVFDFKTYALIKGLRYTIWYETGDRIPFKKITFVLHEDFEEDEVYVVKSKIERDNLLKRINLLCDRYQKTLLKEILQRLIESSFESEFHTTEKAINNVAKALYNGSKLNKEQLCDALNILYKSRNALMSQSSADDFSAFCYNQKEQSLKLLDCLQPIYLKVFKMTSDGVVFFESKAVQSGEAIPVGEEFNSSDIVVFYATDKLKSKIGAPIVFDAINRKFYGGTVVYDN